MAPIDNLPVESVSAVPHTIALPSVAVAPTPFIKKVAIVRVAADVWSKNSVPNAEPGPIVRLDEALPVMNFVADMDATVPFSVNVNAPIDNVFAAPVKVSAPLIVGFPVSAKALAEGQLNSRFPSVTADMLLATPVMVIFPAPE